MFAVRPDNQSDPGSFGSRVARRKDRRLANSRALKRAVFGWNNLEAVGILLCSKRSSCTCAVPCLGSDCRG